MSSLAGVISFPIPPYQNVPIEADFYSPSRFVISDISFGETTTVTTSEDHNYMVGNQVRLIIPPIFGSYQLNMRQGLVLSIPTSDSVELSINSQDVDAFIPSPYIATVTNITNASSAVVTANNSFSVGLNVQFSEVEGMTEINTLVGTITARSSTAFTVSIDSTTFTAYTSAGVATIFNVPQNQAQILAIGDVNTGTANSSGRTNVSTFIPGSFLNISP